MTSESHDDQHSDRSDSASAEAARQGEIILRTRERRLLFLAGLAAMLLLVLLFGLWPAA